MYHLFRVATLLPNSLLISGMSFCPTPCFVHWVIVKVAHAKAELFSKLLLFAWHFFGMGSVRQGTLLGAPILSVDQGIHNCRSVDKFMQELDANGDPIKVFSYPEWQWNVLIKSKVCTSFKNWIPPGFDLWDLRRWFHHISGIYVVSLKGTLQLLGCKCFGFPVQDS